MKDINLTDNTSMRNYGIDFLRIVSMIMIPVLHTLGRGGILENTIPFSAHYEIAWLLEVAAFCAVDSYALITGYVGYGGKHKYCNILYLYFQVIFFTLITTALFLIFKSELVEFSMIKKVVFPFAYETYWYFSAYFCLFFFIPFLNAILDRTSKREIQKLLLVLFIIFSLLPTFFRYDFGNTGGGV